MRMAFISDVHFGAEEDLRAWRLACRILPTMCLDEIILGGDIFDHQALSKYRKAPLAVTTLEKELQHGFKELSYLRESCPADSITFYRGNHERRLDAFLYDVAKPLAGLAALDPFRLYRLGDLDIQYISENKPFSRGRLWVAHGDEFPTSTANPAAKALDALNCNILFGHVHKVSVAVKNQLGGSAFAAWSNSCLCKLNAGYVTNPEWTQGFTLVDFSPGGYFQVTPVIFWYNKKLRKLQTSVEGTLYD